MRKGLITAVLVLFSSAIYSQDLIVTEEGDSLNCKITKEKRDKIYFTFKHKDEVRNTFLPKSSIRNYKSEYFSKEIVPYEKLKTQKEYNKFRLGVNAGYSYNLSKRPLSDPSNENNSYDSPLKKGWHFEYDATYYITEPLGVGLKYLGYNTYNSVENVSIEDIFGNVRVGDLSDDITVSFVGPMFSVRLLSHSRKNAVLLNFAIGYINYLDKLIFVDEYNIKSNTVGVNYDIGYDFSIVKNVQLGLQMSYTSGVLREFELSDDSRSETLKLESNEYEGVNRIDFSLGLRMSF